MDFKPNISPVEVIRKGAFGRTYFRDINSGVNDKFYKNSWREFVELEGIDKKYYEEHDVECGTSLRFWKEKGWVNKIDPYGWFQWYFRY